MNKHTCRFDVDVSSYRKFFLFWKIPVSFSVVCTVFSFSYFPFKNKTVKLSPLYFLLYYKFAICSYILINMTDGGRAKFSLFSSANALNGQVECDENHRSPPKPPLSARSKPNSVKVKPKRPSSANPRLRSNPRRDPAPGRVKINKDKISQQHAIRPQTPPKRQEAQEMDSRGVVLPK